MNIPLLNIPTPPAGMPSSHSSRSIRHRHLYQAQRSGAFDLPVTTNLRTNLLSQRELIAVKNDKIKFGAWLKKWDRDTGVGRYLMLQELIDKCSGMSKSQLDDVFGHSSELVFMHIYIFLRWNCRSGCSVSLQLRALRVFFDASSGFCYAEHFLKKGGTETLIIFLEMQDDLLVEDITEVLNTFLSLTAHGPHAINYIIETKFLEVILDAIPYFPTKENHQQTVMLFAQLAEGNFAHAELFTSAIRAKFPTYSVVSEINEGKMIHPNSPHVNGRRRGERLYPVPQVEKKKIDPLQTAAHIFRILFSPDLAAECDVKNQIGDFLVLTASKSLKVQHEAVSIFQQLLDNSQSIRKKFLFDIIIEHISISIDELPPDTVEKRMRQQTFALRLLQSIVQCKSPTITYICEQIQRILPALVRALSNVDNFSAQKASCSVIVGIIDCWPQAKQMLNNAIPAEWTEMLLEDPHKFCLELTPTQIDTFQSIEPSSFFFEISNETQPQIEKLPVSTPSTTRKINFTQSTIVRPTVTMRESPFKFNPVNIL